MRINRLFFKDLCSELTDDNNGCSSEESQFRLVTETGANIEVKPNLVIDADHNVSTTEEVIETKEIEDATKVDKIDTEDGDAKTIVLVDTNGKESVFDLDEKGNAVKDGEIVVTAEQLLELGNSQVEENQLIDEVATLSGITVVDENNQPITFTNDAAGFAQRENHVYNMALAKGKEEALISLKESNPEILKMLDYKSRFGSLDGYAEVKSFSETVISKDTPLDVLKDIVATSLKNKGNNSSDIADLIAAYETNETLFTKASEHLTQLKAKEVEDNQAYQEQVAQAEAQQVAEIESYYGTKWGAASMVDAGVEGSIYDMIVNKGAIGEYSLPTAGITIVKDGKSKLMSRKDIAAYITQPVKEENGMYFSQYQLDSQNDNSKERTVIDALRILSGGKIGNVMNHLVGKALQDKYKSIKRTNGAVTENPLQNVSVDDINKGLQSGTLRIKTNN